MVQMDEVGVAVQAQGRANGDGESLRSQVDIEMTSAAGCFLLLFWDEEGSAGIFKWRITCLLLVL